MASAEEVRGLLAEQVVGELGDGHTAVRVNALQVAAYARQFTVTVDLTAPDGRWQVALDHGGEEMDVFDGRPSPEAVRSLAVIIVTQLLGWWHAKDSGRGSAHRAQRLP